MEKVSKHETKMAPTPISNGFLQHTEVQIYREAVVRSLNRVVETSLET